MTAQVAPATPMGQFSPDRVVVEPVLCWARPHVYEKMGSPTGASSPSDHPLRHHPVPLAAGDSWPSCHAGFAPQNGQYVTLRGLPLLPAGARLILEAAETVIVMPMLSVSHCAACGETSPLCAGELAGARPAGQSSERERRGTCEGDGEDDFALAGRDTAERAGGMGRHRQGFGGRKDRQGVRAGRAAIQRR